MLSPFPVSPSETGKKGTSLSHSFSLASTRMLLSHPPLPPHHPGIPLHWGIESSQDQGPLFPMISDKAILCHICGWSHGSVTLCYMWFPLIRCTYTWCWLNHLVRDSPIPAQPCCQTICTRFLLIQHNRVDPGAFPNSNLKENNLQSPALT